MPTAVLPDIQREQVQPEHLDEPYEIVQCPIGGGRRAGLAQRLRQQNEFGPQLLAAEIHPFRRGGRLLPPAKIDAIEVHPRPLEPGEDRPALQPVRLVQRQVCEFRQRIDIGLQRREQLRRRRREGVGLAESPRQLADAIQVAPKHRLLVHPHGRGRRVVRHVRIAVAVAADPRSELQDRRQPVAVLGIDGTQRVARLAVDRRHEVEQRPLDDLQPLPHLVEDRRAVDPHEVRHPQRLDLLRDRGQRRLALARQRLDALHPVHLIGDAPDLLEDGPPPCLARVGRKHGNQNRPPQVGGEFVRPYAALPELAQRRLDALADGRGSQLPLALAQHADAGLLFREVDQVEEHRERPDQHTDAG